MKGPIAFVAAMLFAMVGLAADEPSEWPRFRGPDGSGVADGQKPPVELGPDTNVRWKVAVPSGLSSPVVAGDNLVLTAFEDGKLYTIAYRRADGKEAWRAEAPAKEIEAYYDAEGSPAASTSVTDGKRIVSYFGSCGLLCYDLSGKELWTFEMPPAVITGNFGSGASPIISDGLVILVRDETSHSKILALDASDGSLRWETPRQSPISYCTPVVWSLPADKQIVAAGHARMKGYDLKTGVEQWTVAGIPSGCCSSPVTADGMLLFAGWSPGGADDPEFRMPKFDDMLKGLDKNADGILSRDEAEKAFEGFFDTQDTNQDGMITREENDAIVEFMAAGQSTAFALKPGPRDGSEPKMIWKQSKGLPYIPSAIVYEGQYVMVKDGGIVTAYDVKTGDEIYQARVAAPGKYYASPVAANGHIYFASLDGDVTVLKAGTKEPVVVAGNLSLEERIAATPAIADDTLYIRAGGHLYAFTEKE